MKTIKVFLASSEEMKEERLEFADFFCYLNRVFKPRGVFLELSKWEYLDESMGSTRKQQEYNDEIKTCDMCVVLYWTRFGSYTNEELQTAYEELKAGRKPYKLYVYFKETGVVTSELQAFKATFEERYGHFYGKYENIDTLKFRFLLQLENYHNGGAMIIEDAHVKIDGKSVVAIDNVPFAANNEYYQDLKQRIAKLNEEITTLATLLQSVPNDAIEKMLNDKRGERHQLNEELAKYEQTLFGIAMRMSRYVGERVSARMQRAMELFEAGKVSEANVVLEDAEREADASLDEFRRAKQLFKIKKENVVCSIDELMLKASFTIADTLIKPEERIKQAHSLYKKAVELSSECEIEKKKYSEVLKEYWGFLYLYAKYSEAINIAKENLELDKEVFGDCSIETADSYQNLASVYSAKDDYSKALEYYGKSLAIYLAVLGESHPNVAACYNNLGFVYKSKSNYTQAFDYYKKSLEIFLAVWGESHTGVAICYNNLAAVYKSKGNYSDALDYYNKSLEICRDAFGESHQGVALCYSNIGTVHSLQGRYTQALEYYDKSFEILLAVFGKIHPDVATCYNEIGNVYECNGKYVDALEYYNKSLEINLAVFDESHHKVATCYNNIGSVHTQQGDYPQALDYYEKSLAIYLAVFGESHPDVATCYNNKGNLYSSQGNNSKALDYYEKSLAIYLALFGELNPNVATCYNNIGYTYSSLGDYTRALEYYNKSLEIRLLIFGKLYPEVAVCYYNIGCVYGYLGNYSRGLEYYDKSLEIRHAVFGETHPSVIALIEDMVVAYYNIGDKKSTLKYLRRGAAAGSEKCIEYMRKNGIK